MLALIYQVAAVLISQLSTKSVFGLQLEVVYIHTLNFQAQLPEPILHHTSETVISLKA
jgi:hypothetical protein